MAAKLCTVCGKRRQYTGSKGTETAPHLSEMCSYCYEEGGWENSHSDSNHDAILDALDGVQFGLTTHKTKAEYEAWLKEAHAETDMCWICHPELNLAQQPVKAGSIGPKAQGVRRPQLNHKGHSHPQTPAARRACKAAFWAMIAKADMTPEAEASHLPSAMASWNHNCDGNGKPVSAPKGGWAGVAPLGPKGGTGASLKAAGEKAASFRKRLGKVEKKLAKEAGLIK